ncbi:MAG TPA: hypothetical protein VGM76_04190, partial [Lacipirellulaceae bacterium]
MIHPYARRLSLTVLVVLQLYAAAAASTDVWINNVNGNFGDATKWSAGVPAAVDNVIYGLGAGATFTVTFPGQSIIFGTRNYASGAASVGPGNITFSDSSQVFLGPATYTVPALATGGTVAAPSILNTSLLSLSSGTATIGAGSNSPGTLNVNSGTFEVTGSTAAYDLVVGDGGSNSTLNVDAGARVDLTGNLGNAVIGNNAGVIATANVTGSGAVWTNSSNDVDSPLAVGGSGNGTLNVTAGGELSNFSASIARETGSTGSALVSGTGSSWTNRGTLTVGDGGNGSLSVAAGGHISDDSLIVGGSKTGTLTVASGGTIDDNTSSIGTNFTATGSALVTGNGSRWTQAGNLTIGGVGSSSGSSGTGSLHITSAGRVDTGGDVLVGTTGTGNVRLEDAGSQWNVAGAIKVDDKGSLIVVEGAKASANTATVTGSVLVDEVDAAWNVANYLNVAGTVCLGSGCTVPPALVSVGDGAVVNARVAQIAGTFGGAQVFVDGAGSTWNTPEQLYVGLGGTAKFDVTGGALVNIGTTEIGVAPTAGGTVSVNDSNWTNTGDFTVGVAGTGKLTVSFGGTVTVSGAFVVGPKGTAEGNSIIVAKVHSEGHVAPGIAGSPLPANTIGTLQINGAYTQASGAALDIELASTTSLDKLSITGPATLDGTLNITLFNGFTPTVGNSFDLLT